MPESLGQRIARLRAQLGWTQQELAERIGVSRVAISHFEMDLQIPSERTVALLAGVFDCEPRELVASTYYPPAKAERLPPIAARYTAIDRELLLLERDLAWLDRLAHLPQAPRFSHAVLHDWRERLAQLAAQAPDRHSRQRIAAAQQQVQHRLSAAGTPPEC
ncbi:helix-turn-helix transcriptional regulator [Kallotenue papyrolyticum]|uniref:helix-turn-helix transcriptional regulator n=1 Tax=Kallotenue papyrolyticum TaxID=1325125 RepID=UPI0004AE394D|nr:helix-turn-helix transcriptional regulator [Kallotenue papyrolyticum]